MKINIIISQKISVLKQTQKNLNFFNERSSIIDNSNAAPPLKYILN